MDAPLDSAVAPDVAPVPPVTLDRALGAWDGASLTIGAVIGTGIFVLTGQAAAHHVSAHGKDADQISRLVTGHRSDELPDNPTQTVTLTGNEDGIGDVTVPVYDKVGDNPNTRSGKFVSNAAMMLVMEEA